MVAGRSPVFPESSSLMNLLAGLGHTMNGRAIVNLPFHNSSLATANLKLDQI
jgi:hypothetical protein